MLRRKRAAKNRPADRPTEDSAGAPWLSPILVDSTGRDGSTLMMRLLASSSGIAVPGPYPYERRYFAYLWRWARMLERTDRSDLWTPGDLGSMKWDAGKPIIGPPPFESPLLEGGGDAKPPMSRYAFDATWREFSRRAATQVREERDDATADVRYYAEKHQDTWLVDLAPLPRVQVLVLLRDPRDIFVSFHAFDAKRRREGTGTFVGAEPAPGETESEMVERFIAHERERMRWIAGFGREKGFPVFRYENLVTDLAGQAGRLRELLSVGFDPEAVRGDEALRDRHVSADSPAASIGRWRRELEPGLTERFNRELAEELETLGYEPTA